MIGCLNRQATGWGLGRKKSTRTSTQMQILRLVIGMRMRGILRVWLLRRHLRLLWEAGEGLAASKQGGASEADEAKGAEAEVDADMEEAAPDKPQVGMDSELAEMVGARWAFFFPFFFKKKSITRGKWGGKLVSGEGPGQC